MTTFLGQSKDCVLISLFEGAVEGVEVFLKAFFSLGPGKVGGRGHSSHRPLRWRSLPSDWAYFPRQASPGPARGWGNSVSERLNSLRMPAVIVGFPVEPVIGPATHRTNQTYLVDEADG